MKSHTRVAVIGGGVVGCSVLYHLTKAGWKDVVLLERDQLTSGSTWHAAGGFHTLNGDPNVAKLQGYTIGLYDELERISGQSCGLHRSGGLLLADTPERMEWLKMAHGRARYLGLETSLLTPAEAKQLLPLIEEKYFVGAMLDAADGNLDPYGTTQAYAKSARIGGAEIHLQTRVTELARRRDGTWDVVTTAGTINAEHVVNAGGLWAREVGRMVGLELPVLAMEHMYLVTDDMPEVIEFNRVRGRELPHAIDFKAEIYMRQEHNGMVLGTYEKACVPWQPRTTPWDFGSELLPPDLDRITPSLEVGFRHGARRHQAHHQWSVHLLARRQSARRAGAGSARLLVRLRGHGGLQPGRRRRPRALAVDGERRSGVRRMGHGRCALRRVGDPPLHE
jgi:dimethylglycine dehydrogenase